MKIFLFCLFLCLGNVALQAQDSKELQQTAKSFMRQGDYANAVLVLNRAFSAEPGNIDIAKDLSLSYYLQKDNTRALEIIKPFLDKDNADDQTFQIAASIYRQQDDSKEAEKLYKKALKKFPKSGPIYNELGELQFSQKNYDAIKQWEQGIQSDPSYSKNYYNAARYYFFSPDKVWGLLYGEIFVNMDPLSSKTPEIKQMLLDGYKKLFADANLEAAYKEKNNFVKRYLQNMNQQTNVATSGINVSTLSMIRTRFILDWFNSAHAQKFPFRLFDLQQQLLREGLFEAYNQWLFGSTQNLSAYQSWTAMHPAENNEFIKFQSGRVFKIPEGEYYK